MPINCLHCNSEGRIKQVISVQSTAQELEDCKQKYDLACRAQDQILGR